ncbi:MAG: ISAs1 family transposase [Holophagaceae bacterium]|nr:ISAs1 family transposase [Holophagaceae bacterium]
MAAKNPSLTFHLSALPDPRSERGRRHLLLDVMIMAVVATLCGADDWESVEAFGDEQESWLRTFLELPNGIPSHDIFSRVFRMLDTKAFTECFLAWSRSVRRKVSKDVVAIDGKTLRASMDADQSPLHLVSAWSSANRMVLGQRAVDGKSNEIKAIPELLKVLDLAGCIVTIDAMGCQKDIALAITRRKADYILALKANQKGLHQVTQALFEVCDAGEQAMTHAHCISTDEGYGRKVVREVMTINAVHTLGEEMLLDWPMLETVARVRTTAEREGKTIREDRFYISSLPTNAVEAMAEGIRSHWGIENGLHWVLDVAFNEDRNRTRKGTAAEAGAILRHIVLNLLWQDPDSKRSIKNRRMKAALNPVYRLDALIGFRQDDMH